MNPSMKSFKNLISLAPKEQDHKLSNNLMELLKLHYLSNAFLVFPRDRMTMPSLLYFFIQAFKIQSISFWH